MRKKTDKAVAVSDSQKRAVSALRRAEKLQIVKEKYTLGVYVPEKDKHYGLPFCCPTDDIAAQSFRSFVDSPESTIMKGSDLWKIAEYRFDIGEIKPLNLPKFISY